MQTDIRTLLKNNALIQDAQWQIKANNTSFLVRVSQIKSKQEIYFYKLVFQYVARVITKRIF